MPENILIVDDEPDMLKLLSMIIRDKTPYGVTTTNNPLEVVDLLKAGSFELIIADLKMPGLDGIELLGAIKNIDNDLPVIIITAYGTFETATEALKKGGFDFITKPFRKEQILYTIDKALKWYALQKENRQLRQRLQSLQQQ
ncbi:MAG: response regulator [Nitrospirae bacterium]|uniref:response regulator n=1 Tax=Candidatus Magnetobacterium casense TaxID=1455061 RepID=UPI00058B7F16|nr:response regulator [Candidatus Magnetobacterium casensis]MBF0338066.1 response regulator [Nitrospirota bacterium]